MLFELVKTAHILGACVLIGTGSGIAFFMLVSHRTGDVAGIAHTAGIVVLADFVFTATAAVAQPITGLWLVWQGGWGLTEFWVLASIALYLFIGALWLPVVGIQMRMKRLADAALAEGQALPAAYHRLFRIWFACGVPAFAAILALLWLMVTKPTIG
jgi:uncharacterized membrane protein